MTTEAEITKKFWKALKSDMTVMLGLHGVDETHAKPMTAQLDGDGERGPIYFFTAKTTDLVQTMGQRHTALLQFASKGHHVFATVEGQLSLDDDRAAIDRLWSPFVAAWFKGGKDDLDLQLLRFDPDHAQIWLNENSVFAGMKLLIGSDPKKEYKDKAADVRLS